MTDNPFAPYHIDYSKFANPIDPVEFERIRASCRAFRKIRESLPVEPISERKKRMIEEDYQDGLEGSGLAS